MAPVNDTSEPPRDGGPAGEESQAPSPPEPPRPSGINFGDSEDSGGARSLAMRIGIILVVVLLVATLGFALVALVRGVRKPSANGTPTESPGVTATVSSTPSPTKTLIPMSDPRNEFSIDRPSDWEIRNVAPIPNNVLALAVGPPPPYPVDDLVTVEFEPLATALGPNALQPFGRLVRDTLEKGGASIVSQQPLVVHGLVAWYFVYGTPASSTNTGSLRAAYYLLDGDRIAKILLQVKPLTDQQGFLALGPVFQQMAGSFVSFHHAATPTSTATSPPTGTASPTK
jgi:hypothetical protein